VGIVIHHTWVPESAKDKDETYWKKLFKNISAYLARKDKTYVSAHYHIGKYGECDELVDPDSSVAFHAGVSSFWNPISRTVVSGCNEHFIGIELLGDGNVMPYSSEQYDRLCKLLLFLMRNYPTIQPNLIVGHEMVSPGRKVDPGSFFDWRRMYRGLGLDI